MGRGEAEGPDAAAAQRRSGAGFLTVATVRRPHGTRGEMVIELDTDHPEQVFVEGRVLRVGNAASEPTGGELTVERARRFKDGLLLRTREHAGLTPELEALRGASLLIAASEAAPLAQDEIFYHDLIGMRVVVNGLEIGPVRDVYTLPQGDVLAVARAGQGDLLVPFVGPMIRSVDREAGRIEIEGPAGLEAL